ncbi:MAG: redoxin domain-containing protein [Candidatus Aminicenantes bacterium]|nr:redoxin domain-containing protein [Candidatus Aminicenantes bacterium]NIM78460.1 redoxin domain-containing protein [Candidatus Aminicenantes bacterium]NIN17723.1 redoxin domain-containing protein [Candidatus Aminicenantes bacterium]NIN41599.1 redoxin domain-containing protein [Candidatus Aminicenantes bacterium]NIN84373.1 redoxin domain-containing protein [Candidatus Aminicenantes bacterium]
MGDKQFLKKEIRLTTFFITIILLVGILYSDEIGFGSKIKEINSVDINNKKIEIPEKGKVTVLLFFNVKITSHQKLVSEFNFFFKNLVDQGKKVDLIYISKGEPKEFKSLVDKYNIKFRFVNDIDEKILSIFDYSCGECNKIIIIDKESKLRYNASYIDFYYIKSITDRYDTESRGGK